MLDELDFKLIHALQQDSRQSNLVLAEKLGVSESTVRRRTAMLIENDIVKFTVFINPEQAGFPVTANILFHVKPDKIEEVSTKIAEIDAFYSVSVVTGPYDVVAAGYFRSVDAIYDLIRNQVGKIEGIVKVETGVILKRKKRAY
jgi:Lrp/AsnC family transcriptional regulator, regulator for asnA, asnC and gidA